MGEWEGKRVDTDEAALLRSILEEPANDTPRLVYADWLEERAGTTICSRCDGHRFIEYPEPTYSGTSKTTCFRCGGTGRIPNGYAERAEFIRVQCELSRNPNADHKLAVRAAKLLDTFSPANPIGQTNERAWRGSEAFWGQVQCRWSRGFVYRISLTHEAFVRHVANLFARQPIDTVVFADTMPAVCLDIVAPSKKSEWQVRLYFNDNFAPEMTSDFSTRAEMISKMTDVLQTPAPRNPGRR